MEDVSDAFGEEAKVGGLAPNEEVEGDVEKFAAAVVIGGVGFYKYSEHKLFSRQGIKVETFHHQNPQYHCLNLLM